MLANKSYGETKLRSDVLDIKKFTHNCMSRQSSNSTVIESKRNEEVATEMDDNILLQKYLDKVDQDRRDQEERLSKNIQLMEHRISEERKASEERLEKMFLTTMESIKDTNNKIDELSRRVNENEKTLIKEISSANKDIRNISISTIVGIAAMVITIIIAFFTMKPS